MKLTGVWLTLLDIPPESTEEFNLWYDVDHMPEHVSRPDILSGRRYVAPAGLRRLDGVHSCDLTGGHPPYASLYYFGGPTDFLSAEAAAAQRATDRRIVKAGRYWRSGRPAFHGLWHLAAVRTRASVHVADDAVPYLPHRSLLVMLGRASAAERVDEAVAWWDSTQSDDLHDITGVLASMRFTPGPPGDPDLILHLVLCRAPAAEVMRDLSQVRHLHRLTGRYPAYSGSYETVAVLPYQSIIPFQYDFEMDGGLD